MAIEKATRKSTEKTKKGKPVGKAVLLDSTDSRMQVEGEDYGDYTPINGKYYGVSKNYTKEKEATVKLLDATSATAKSATTQVVTSPVTQTASSDSQSRSLANSAASPRPVAGIPSRKSTLLDSELMPSKNLLDAKIFPILSSAAPTQVPKVATPATPTNPTGTSPQTVNGATIPTTPPRVDFIATKYLNGSLAQMKKYREQAYRVPTPEAIQPIYNQKTADGKPLYIGSTNDDTKGVRGFVINGEIVPSSVSSYSTTPLKKYNPETKTYEIVPAIEDRLSPEYKREVTKWDTPSTDPKAELERNRQRAMGVLPEPLTLAKAEAVYYNRTQKKEVSRFDVNGKPKPYFQWQAEVAKEEKDVEARKEVELKIFTDKVRNNPDIAYYYARTILQTRDAERVRHFETYNKPKPGGGAIGQLMSTNLIGSRLELLDKSHVFDTWVESGLIERESKYYEDFDYELTKQTGVFQERSRYNTKDVNELQKEKEKQRTKDDIEKRQKLMEKRKKKMNKNK